MMTSFELEDLLDNKIVDAKFATNSDGIVLTTLMKGLAVKYQHSVIPKVDNTDIIKLTVVCDNTEYKLTITNKNIQLSTLDSEYELVTTVVKIQTDFLQTVVKTYKHITTVVKKRDPDYLVTIYYHLDSGCKLSCEFLLVQKISDSELISDCNPM